MREKNWDKYEVALLIEAFLAIENGADKISILQELSLQLRKMAKIDGFDIDDKFRNLNGMQWQLGFIKLAFNGSSWENRKPPKLFIEGVATYKENREEYLRILGEAKEKIRQGAKEMTADENKQSFIKWFEVFDGRKCTVELFLDHFEKVSSYAKKYNISKSDFWEIKNVKYFNSIRTSLSGNRIFKFTHPKLFSFFEKWGKLYALFLKDKYPTQDQRREDDHKKEELAVVEPIQEKVITISDEPVETTEDVGQEFSKWLLSEGLSESSSRSYLGSLRSASDYAQEHSILDKAIFAFGKEELPEAVRTILKDEEFARYNVEQHNRFSAALKKYVVFQCGESALALLGGRKARVKEVEGKERKQKRNYMQVECPSQLAIILDRSFAYGFALNIPNDMLRLKSLASMFGIELVDDEELLKQQILAHGLRIDDVVYFFNDSFYTELGEKIEQVFSTGYDVIFYEAFINNNQIWADENHVVDSLILRELMYRCDNSLFFGKTCVVKSEKLTEAEAVVKEIQRIASGNVLVCVDEAVNQLPYIPEDKIKFHLSVNRWFVRNESNIYADVTKFLYSAEEKQAILDYIQTNCQENGYASIVDIPLGHLMENNDLFTENAFFNAVFNLFLYDDYYLNGKIVTKEKNGIDATALVENYCRSKERCTVEELVKFVKDITGEGTRRYALEGAYNSMIRIDENTFVADSFLTFDVAEIDTLLEQYIKDEFDAITSISVFTLFPSCGMGWNYYILESYVYRFSQKFRLSNYNFNDKNAGIIVSRKCLLTYEEMLAKEVVRKNVPCEKGAIGLHLCQNGFTAKSKMTLYDMVIEKTKKFKGV